MTSWVRVARGHVVRCASPPGPPGAPTLSSAVRPLEGTRLVTRTHASQRTASSHSLLWNVQECHHLVAGDQPAGGFTPRKPATATNQGDFPLEPGLTSSPCGHISGTALTLGWRPCHQSWACLPRPDPNSPQGRGREPRNCSAETPPLPSTFLREGQKQVWEGRLALDPAVTIISAAFNKSRNLPF